MTDRLDADINMALTSMQKQIDALQRRSRRIGWLCLCLTGVIAFLSFNPMAQTNRSQVWASDGEQSKAGGTAKLERIRCRSLEVVDFKGQRRLTISPGGTIDIFDEAGRERISCGLFRAGTSASEESSQFILKNSSGNTQLRLSEQFGGPYIGLRDKQGGTRMQLSWHKATDSRIQMFDEDRNVTWTLPSK